VHDIPSFFVLIVIFTIIYNIIHDRGDVKKIINISYCFLNILSILQNPTLSKIREGMTTLTVPPLLQGKRGGQGVSLVKGVEEKAVLTG